MIIETKYCTKKLFSKQELILYRKLKKYLKKRNDLILLTKVRLADYIKDENEDKDAFFKIGYKHLDFIITDYRWNIKVWIELDWKEHKTDKRKIKNDIFKEKLFKEIGIKIVRFQNYKFSNFHKLDEYIGFI